MCAHMSFEVKGVIETLPTVGAKVSLDVIVTFHVTVEHALVGEGLMADVTGEELPAWAVSYSHLPRNRAMSDCTDPKLLP